MRNTLKFLIIIALMAAARNPVPVFAQNGNRTQAYFNMLSSGNYHMVAKMMEGRTETTIETFARGELMASTITVQGEITRVVYKDRKSYMILDSAKMIMITAMNNPSEAKSVKTDGMRFTGSGTARFNGKDLPYDEYSGTNGEKVQFFVDGNNLAGIRNIIPRQNAVDLVILTLDQNIPNNAFDIPTSGYQIQDMSSFGR